MKTRLMIATAIALVFAPSAGSRVTATYWSEFDATQRLETGRFAARNDVDQATCLGTGAISRDKYGTKRYRSFDCTAWGRGFENKRQLTVRVTGPTTFAVTWLRQQTCRP